MKKPKSITVAVEQRHITEARHAEADQGRELGTDPISRAVVDALKEAGIPHERAWIYRKPGLHQLWLSLRPNEEVRLPAECGQFTTNFDKRLDWKPQPFRFLLELP